MQGKKIAHVIVQICPRLTLSLRCRQDFLIEFQPPVVYDFKEIIHNHSNKWPSDWCFIVESK